MRFITGNDGQEYVTDELGVPFDAWQCAFDEDDPDWRLCEGAVNSWTGVIEDKRGEQMLDLSMWADRDFEAAFEFAKRVVADFNKTRFNFVPGNS